MKPQHRDQSKRVRLQNSNNWTTVFSSSSKDRRFRSDQIVHIKQPGIKSQISELCFPIQWYQLNNKSTTEPGMTQSIPNNWSIDIHKEWVIGQTISSHSSSSFHQYGSTYLWEKFPHFKSYPTILAFPVFHLFILTFSFQFAYDLLGYAVENFV